MSLRNGGGSVKNSSCRPVVFQITTQGTKIFQYCTCPAGRVTYNFHLPCKHMHLSFKSICNKEHKGVICNMTSSSNFPLSTRPTGRVLWEELLVFLDFTHNNQRTNGIFDPCHPSFETLFSYQGNTVYYSVYYKSSSDVFNEKKKKKITFLTIQDVKLYVVIQMYIEMQMMTTK